MGYTIMNRDAMLAFRQRYRADISRYYCGWLHMLSVAAIGLAVIGYSIAQLRQPELGDWLLLPATLVLVNFAEYYAHRWLGHRKTRLGKLFYQRHSGDHHSFFLHDAMNYESVRDWRVVLFPSYLIIAFTVGLVLPGGYLLSQTLGDNAAYFYAIGAIGGYLLYEVLHFSYHIAEGRWEEKLFLFIPGWQALRNSHRLHHHRDKMTEKNFNITLPIFDYLLGSRE